jgi:preprotein translocase subunit SecD
MMQRRPARKRPRMSRNGWLLLLILALLGTSIWILTPSGSAVLHRDEGYLGLRLGLDLKGGTHLVYQGEFSDNVSADDKDAKMDGVARSIETRIDRYGVVEPVIQRQGDDRILIQLPGITNLEEAKSLIEETAFLEFREVEVKDDGKPATLADYLSDNRTEFFDSAVAGIRIFAFPAAGGSQPPIVLLEERNGSLEYVDVNGNPIDPETLEEDRKGAYSWMPAVGEAGEPLTGAYLTKAEPQYEQTQTGVSKVVVAIGWNSEGAVIFDDVAGRLYLRKSPPLDALGIFLDSDLISSPTIQQPEYGGSAVIEGDFTYKEARLLAIQLDSGALPVPLKSLFSSEVSATLGANFVHKALVAGLVGFLVVALFMMLYYRLPGVIAILALAVYAILVLAIYKLIPVTMTLAGIAGFIVSLGMAVDANVLIFERMKEELRGGRTLKAAMDAGFSRAWLAIRDSNFSTFIACAILYWFGSSIVTSPAVKGFALTLFIGVAVSMFSAIVSTRTFLLLFTGPWATKKLTWFGVEAKPGGGSQ